MRVAIASMPFGLPHIAPLGPAVLKAHLEKAGHRVDCHHLNLRLARRCEDLFRAFYDRILPGYWLEWFFSYHLFGPGGTGELSRSLDDLYELSFARGYLQEIDGDVPRPHERLRALVEEDVPAFLRECLEEIPWGGYDLIGFSSLFWSHAACLTLARALKARHPKIPIVLGGANVDGEMGLATLKGCEWIDYVVEREGERALLALVENLEAGKPFEPVPNVSLRRGGEVVPCKDHFPSLSMDELPTPDHDDYFAQLRAAGLERWLEPEVTFETSRGCWWGQKQHCVFCGFNRQGITFRARDPELVVADVAALYERYRRPLMRAVDDIMAVEHYDTLVPRLAEERERLGADWDIWWETKANLTAAQVSAFAAAGIRRLQPGIESFSTPILRLMKKGSRGIQNIQTIKASTAVGIDVRYLLLYGFHGEDPREYERLADLVVSLTHLPPAVTYALRIDRFSPMHFDWPSFGGAKPIADWFYSLIYPASRFDLDAIAYFFRDSLDRQPERDRRAEPFRRAVEWWNRVHARSRFDQEAVGDEIRLFDSRPEPGQEAAAPRESALSGREALVFSACETLKTFGQILADCRREDPSMSESECRALLESFVARRWALREETQYLNLALPAARVPSQRSRASSAA